MLKELQGRRRCLDGAMEEWARVGRLFRLIVARYVVSAHALRTPGSTDRFWPDSACEHAPQLALGTPSRPSRSRTCRLYRAQSRSEFSMTILSSGNRSNSASVMSR